MKTNFNIAKNVRNSRSISALSALRKLHGLGLLLCALMIGSLQAWGLSVTYTTSSGFPSASGNTITGATASFSDNTNQSNHTQMLASGNMTLTLTSLGGINISNITLSMKSNSSKGAGTLCYSTDGGSNWTYLVGSSGNGVNFNNTNWNGSWSTSYVDVSKNVTLNNVTQLKIKIDATVNSLYCQSFKLTYTAGAASSFTVTIAKNQASWGSVDKSSVTNVANNTSISASSNVLTVGATTVTATPHAQDANYNYAFSSWSGIPAGGKVTASVTVTANFTRTARTMTNYRTSCVACEEPTSVSITGTNKYLGGQTISLTATPTGGTGTPSYQWQKKINGTWTNLANGGSISGATSNNLQISSCGYGNSGGYRCIVSTGEGCETKSHADDTDGYGVHVFSLNGGYYGGDWSAHDITWTSGTTGTATVHLNASSTYMFRVYSNHGYYYGNGENNYIIQPVSWDCGTGNNDMRLFTGPEGDYTFTVNIEHGLDGSPYVNVQVGYPTVSHPSTGYIYISKWWDCYVHYWEGTNNDLTTWGYDPKIDENRYATICGNNYWYFPVIATYNKFIAKDNAGNPGNTTGDQVTTSHGGMYITHDGNAWVWRDFTTYTITYSGGEGGTGGPMAPNTGICPGSSQQLTANAFSKAYHTFNGWSDGNGHTYANQATITDIQSNIDLTAQWTPEQYNITATLANVTSTTSFPVAYTYTGSAAGLTYTFTAESGYCLPNDVTVSGSTYTWDKASGELTLTGVITSDVSITVTAVQAYTVTFVHHDKGTYSGGSTEWIVPSNDATITLPTVTDVSCGFYDTFEGWIASNSEYAESDDKPATVYAGGGSYTVTGNVTLRALYSYEDPNATGYTKITSGVTAGTYLISTDKGSDDVAYTGKVDGQTYGGYTSVTVSAGAISSKGSAQEVTITLGTGANAGKFAIYDGTYYLSSPSSNSLTFNNSITYDWELSSESGKEGEIHSLGQNTRYLQFNNSANPKRFACYTHTQNATFLFKKGGSKYCTNPSCSTPTQVTVTYNANGGGTGSITCTSETLDYGTYPALDDDYTICNTFNREGYTLYKWSTRADGEGGTSYDPGEVVGPGHTHEGFSGENVTLYAQWRKKVSFNIGNATGSVADVVDTDNDGNITLPGSTGITAIPCGYEFWGWRASSVSETTTRPNNMLFAGDTYNCASATLYAVYRLADGSVDPNLFSLSYTYNSTKYYVGYPRSSSADVATQLLGSTSSAEAAAFGVESVDFQTYKALYYMNEGVKEYLYWYAGDGTSIRHTPTKPTDKGWTVYEGTGTKRLVPSNATDRNIDFNDDSSDPRFRTYQNNTGNLTVEEASGTSYTYATNPSCVTTATLAFVTNGGTLNYPTAYDASNYVDLTVGTNVYLPTATFPGEWVFEGWMKGSELPSQATSPAGDPNFYTVTLNTTQYTASPAGTTTFYAVYSKTVDDKQWDPTAEGTYKIYAIMSDGTTKKYMPAWGGTQTTLSFTTACPEAGEYTITPGTGEHTGQYKITHSTYTLGVVSDADTKFKNVADAWWNIEASTSGKGTYRITIVGSSNRCLSYSGFDTFGNYTISQVNSPSQPNYRDVEIGECIYTEYTSTPENIPYITITGSPVKITSTNGEKVYSPTKIHIEAHNFTGERIIHLSATNRFGVDPSEVRTNSITGAFSGDVDVYYYPNEAGDGSIVSSVLTAAQTGGTIPERISQTFTAIKGRNLPQNFVIAVKSGEQWYALPDDCHSSGTPKAVPIEVNDPNAPTAASRVPHNTEWRLSDVVNSNNRPKDKVYFYEPNSTNNYTLYAGSAPNIQTNAQLSNVTGENSYTYEWGLTTSDLCAYTIGNANVGKNISINTAGNFGTHASGIVSSTLYLLPITAYYETAAMQVLEWKANSVVVMYTGTQTTATTKVGDNSASIAQTLSNQKLTHGIYELTTGQELTANAGAALKVSFGGGAEMAIVTIPIIINSDVTANADHTSEDVIIVSGGKLTAAATKYSFHNIYVYGGGKLKIASGSQLGVNNIILRAGGVTTNGSGGSATYAYTYPQVELGGTLTSTQTNIRYEYITDYDHWYQLCLPFNGTLSSITYPQEYYGDNVEAGNKGSWIIKRYAGEVRATGNYDAWKDIEKDSPAKTEVTAGNGYLFWGAPKKVTIGGDKQRQTWGIQRMTMSVTAAAATTAETNNKNITVDSYSSVEGKSTKPNDQGWNLVGNPYMVNLTDLSSESMIAGQLVPTETVPWDGKWRNNGDDIRYVTIPDNHFDSYVAKTASVAAGAGDFMPGRAFFVQIAEGATTLTFAATNRASLMPALFARTEQKIDVETGIVMSDESKQDEVNFWIKDGKTEAYEYNADYPKTMNTTNFNIYGVHSNGELSWVAISPEIAEGSMAIGYQVPAAGDYMLSLSETYVSDEIEHVFVTDHGVSPEVTTDLMEEDYNFYVNQAETNDVRFTVAFKLKEEDSGTSTNVENTAGVDSDKPLKFIYNDKMYILRNGIIYDAVGKRVSEINK